MDQCHNDATVCWHIAYNNLVCSFLITISVNGCLGTILQDVFSGSRSLLNFSGLPVFRHNNSVALWKGFGASNSIISRSTCVVKNNADAVSCVIIRTCYLERSDSISFFSESLASCLSKLLFLAKLHLMHFGICHVMPRESAIEHPAELGFLPE